MIKRLLIGGVMALGIYFGVSSYLNKLHAERLYRSHPCYQDVERFREKYRNENNPERIRVFKEGLGLLEKECRDLAILEYSVNKANEILK